MLQKLLYLLSMKYFGGSLQLVLICHLFVWSAPTSKNYSSKNDGGFASFLHPKMILMSINFIVVIKTTYRTIGWGETHCRRRIKEYQTYQNEQQLYGNEYNPYLIIIYSQQIKNEVIFYLYDVEDIWLLYKVY